MLLSMELGLMLWLRAGVIVLAVLSLSACAYDEPNDAVENRPASSTSATSSLTTSLVTTALVKNTTLANNADKQIKPENYYLDYADKIYQILLAEYHYQHADYEKSSYLYSSLLAQSTDKPENSRVTPSVALYKRATGLAIKIEDHDQALRSALQWKKLEPNSPAVNQSLVLLYQKKGQYEKSADVLADLVKAYPAEKGKPVDIAVALLEQQAEVGDAYQTLKHYSQKYTQNHSQKHSQKHSKGSFNKNPKGNNNSKEGDIAYYIAIFAMRAKLYDEVLAATDNLDQITDKELKQKAALLRIKVFTATDKPEKALEELKTLIAEAADLSTRQTYARIMASLGKGEEAVAMLNQSFEKHPDNADLLLDIIAINLGEEKYEESLPYLDKLQALNGQATNAHYFRGIIFESLGRFSEALNEYMAIDKDKQSIQIYTRVAFVLVKEESLESALSFLHEKQDQHESANYKKELYLLESEILRQAHSFDEAIVANKKAQKLAPMDLNIVYSQALLYEDAEQIDKSEEQLLKILTIDHNHVSALNALGYMLSVHTQRFDEAYIYIKKAYDLEPDDPAIIDSLGWVSYRKGDLKDAEKYLRLAYQKLKDPEVASHLVEVLTKQGQQEEASNLLAEMLKKHPKNKKLIKAQALIEKSK